MFQHIKNNNLKAIQVPHLPKLRVNDIIRFARSKIAIDDYLPKFKNEEKVPDRTWL